MENESSYWAPLGTLVSQHRCWVRVTWREGASVQEGWWGQLFAMPAEGYIEVAGGPILLRDVEWVDVSTSRVNGGIGGRPRQVIDMKDEILADLQTTPFNWEFRETKWSIPGIFEEEPVQVIRIENPFGPASRR